MATEFRLPEVGENVASGQVVKLMVSAGDTIEHNQAILELETDKAVIEVPSTVSGKIQRVHIKEGEELKVGQVIMTVEEAGAAGEALTPEPGAVQAEETKAPVQVEARKPEPQAAAEEVERAPEKETRPAPHLPPGEQMEGARPVPTGEVLGPSEVAPAAPSVRRLARELGVDINQVPGSGPGGRISAEDVKQYIRQLQEKERAAPPLVATPAREEELPDFTRWGEVERAKMTGVRRTTARRLAQAWSTIPHVTNFDKADITELEALRKQYAERAQTAGGKLTVTAILVKVAASALKVFPKFNASLDMANEEIIYKKYYHIGIAVDTEHGLLVPVIRDVDRKNLVQLSVEMTELAEKARNRKVSPEELEGGNFTLTNLGGIGGTNFTPIINPPTVAILGVARASMEPVFKDGGFEPRLMLPLALSYDHRLIDGADAARFLRWVVQAIEQPFLLALEG